MDLSSSRAPLRWERTEREESLNVLASSATCTLRGMDDQSIRKLHGLYQVIEPPHDKQCERALVVVSQLHRKPPSKRAVTGDASGSGAPQGELEWIVGLAGPGKPDPDAKGKKREPADEWWESRLSSDEIAEWLDEVRLPRLHAIGQSLLNRADSNRRALPTKIRSTCFRNFALLGKTVNCTSRAMLVRALTLAWDSR